MILGEVEKFYRAKSFGSYLSALFGNIGKSMKLKSQLKSQDANKTLILATSLQCAIVTCVFSTPAVYPEI